MNKLLVIGPLMTESSLSFGGVVVLFSDFVNHLKKFNVDHTIIGINSNKSKLYTFININVKVLKKIKGHTHVSLHGTANNFLFFGPFLVVYCKIFGKKLSLRKFAGNFDSIYENSNFFKKRIIEFVLKKSDSVFFETKYLIEFFKKFNVNTFWFPNVRVTSEFNTSFKFKKKFIYLGSIQEEKGIDDLLKASRYLSDSYKIDLYGNIREDKYKYLEKWNNKIVSYKGIIKPTEVQRILSLYDVLILPSYREGYPGVIVEAYSVGLPVIATSLKGISEIVENGISGILCPTNSPLELSKAIKYFDSKNYSKFRYEAKRSFNHFDSALQSEKILKIMLRES